MKRKLLIIVSIALLMLLAVSCFACAENKITSLKAKYELISLPLNSTINIDNYIEYEGKGELFYSVENTSVLKLEKNKITAIGLGRGNVIIDAGNLSARFGIIVTDGSNVNIEAIENTVEYDGELKNIIVDGALPENSEVKYFCEGEDFFGAKEIGTYNIDIEVKLPDGYKANYINKSAVLTITRGIYDMRAVSFASKTFTYDGQEKKVEITGSLPDGVTVSYLSNKATDAGVYLAKAVFHCDEEHYEPITEMTARLTINRKSFELNANGFSNTYITYDGLGHKVELSSLPDGLTVEYFLTNDLQDVPMPVNGVINSGTYTIKAVFSVEQNSIFSKNYNTISAKSITLVISKANFYSEDLAWKAMPSGGFVYNGTKLTIGTGEGFDVGLIGSMPSGLNGEFPQGATASYKYLDGGIIKDAQSIDFINAGRYSIWAEFTMPEDYETNYNPLEDMPFTILINKATFDMSGVTLSPIDNNGVSFAQARAYDELTHTFLVEAEQAKLDCLSIAYYLKVNNGTSVLIGSEGISLTSVANYEITAEFELKDNKENYMLIPSQSIQVAITKMAIPIDGMEFIGKEVTYNEQVHSLVISNLPDNVTAQFSENNQTNAGTYNVTATLFYKDIDARNYYFTLNGNTVNNLTAVLKINKATLTIEDVPECSVTGGAYNHTKTLADYPIIGIESSKIRWVNPQTVPTVNVTNYRVIYNPDANNYFDFQFGLPLAITKAEIDGATMVIESQFLPYTGVVAKPNFTVNGNKDALMLEFVCETDMTSIGKHNVTAINVSLIDTDNYTIINTPTIGARYFCIYSSSIYEYQGLQLVKYKGSAATVSLMDGTKSIRSDAFKDNTYVRAITVPDSVTSISLNAFSSIPNLYEITLPFIGRTQNAGEELGKVFGGTNQSNLPQTLEKVTVSLDGEISVSAFANASYIKEVNYLTEVTGIGSTAFENCAALENVYLGDSVISIGEGIFRYCFNLKEIKLPFIGSNISDIKTISYLIGSNAGENLYTKYSCGKIELTSESLVALPDEFLKDFSSLNTVILPQSVASYGSKWVSGVSAPIALNPNMTALTYGILHGYKGTAITLPESVAQIAAAAFYNATNLQQIVLPLKVTSIGEEAFYNVTASIVFAEGTTISNLGNKAFYNYGGGSLTIPDAVTTLGNSVFESSKITSLRIPSNVINMGSNIFKGCTLLKTVNYEATYVASNMFTNCSALYNISFSSSLEEIKASAFESCNALFAINIGANVTNIGDKAFYNCLNLTIINMFSANPPDLGANAFVKTVAIKVYILSLDYMTSYQNKYITQYGYSNMEFSKML